MHLIGQLTLEPRTFSRALGERVAQKLPDLAEDILIPVIEECFEKIAPEREIRIDRLVCDLGAINFRNLQSEFPKLLAKALEAHFDDHPKEFPAQAIDLIERGRSVQSNARSTLEVFLFILKNGHFPWWFAESEWENFPSLGKWVDESLEALGRIILKSISHRETIILHRLIRHVSLASIKELCTRNQERQPLLAEHRDTIAGAPKDEQLRLMIALWLSSISHNEERLFILESPEFQKLSPSSRLLFEKMWAVSPSPPTQSRPPFDYSEEDFLSTDSTPLSRGNEHPEVDIFPEAAPSPNQKEALTISNSGLVLLHPFLARFFRSMNWLGKDGGIEPEHQWLAVQALQFLSRGECGLAEPTLVLEKILCGITLGSPAEFPPLAESTRGECQQLLLAAIEHWSILKNTTPEGLRDGFLLRPGSLFQQDKQWHLRVERKAIDVLLDHLPWPLQMVKLPWLKSPIHVHWQND